MAADEHQVYATKGDIPYKHIELLGHGASGYVDKVHDVVSPNAVYARKIIRMEASYRREAELAVIENEVRIIRRLRHRHVITALATYQCERDFAIIMLPVADTDLKSFLEQADNMPLSVERYSMMFMMQKWPGCLIQAIDYLHEVRVKHKDIKPANLLITRGNICITDFGVAKDLSHELTTASTGTVGPHTPLYCAPEVAFSGARRGRAADIFSLGCVFLEISTIVLGRIGSLRQFHHYRESRNGSHSYAGCPQKLLQWIWNLRSLWEFAYSPSEPNEDIRQHEIRSCNLAFLMLDPEPKMRITARQLVALMNSRHYFGGIKNKACSDCIRGGVEEQLNLPLHSLFKYKDDIVFATKPEEALTTEVAPNWEAAKRAWLSHHMWW